MSRESPKYIVQEILPREPVKVSLVNTNDGMEKPFHKDGGTFRNKRLAVPNSGTAQLMSALAKKNKAGGRLFVASEPIEPAYLGDPLCTPKDGRISLIPLLTEASSSQMETLVKKREESNAALAVSGAANAAASAAKEDSSLADKLKAAARKRVGKNKGDEG